MACQITEAEQKIMEVLWRRPRLTVKEIAESLTHLGWSYPTVRTLVFRLMEKGAISADKKGKSFHYFAVLDEGETKKMQTKSFLDRVYQGSVKMLMQTLVDDSGISEEEAQKLLEIVDKMQD